ncbi:MAG: toll/interleukin-1 receptor domain-containing protein [Marinifilaceae bacterium]
MIKQQPITAEVLESICKVIADTGSGLTGSEIGRILDDSRITDTNPSMTKWKRLYNAFVAKQNSTNCSNNILTFLQKAMQPVRYVGQNELFENRLNELNKILIFTGLELSKNGKYRKVDSTTTIPKADHKKTIEVENSMKKETLKYDLAISFAGEDREIAERIAKRLTELNHKVFYDKYEQATLWGKDLFTHLNEIYSNSAKYCLMIISKDYAEKQWTSHERKAAQARAFRQNKEYILPLKLDDTEIPGINETVGYIDYRKVDFQEIIQLLEYKIEE